jgi:hypothetical protein
MRVAKSTIKRVFVGTSALFRTLPAESLSMRKEEVKNFLIGALSLPCVVLRVRFSRGVICRIADPSLEEKTEE